MLLQLFDHLVVDLIHVSVVWIDTLKSGSDLLELSIKVILALLEFSLLPDRVSKISEPTLEVVDLISILSIPDHVVSILLFVDFKILGDRLMIRVWHCDSELLVELLELEGGISLPLLE